MSLYDQISSINQQQNIQEKQAALGTYTSSVATESSVLQPHEKVSASFNWRLIVVIAIIAFVVLITSFFIIKFCKSNKRVYWKTKMN